jgi:riboflavin kinase
MVETLKQLALLGAIHEHIPVSTAQLGKLMGISQQSASVRVLELLDAGLITRNLGARRQQLKLTDKAMEILRSEYAAYQKIFELEAQLRVRGRVARGLGEGFYYMSQEGYREQFRIKLGFDPYPGTLNLRLDSRELSKLDVLRRGDGILIEGFTAEGRSFGGARCFFASIGEVDCAVIMPFRSHYDDVLEVISRHHLRQKLGLKDGDRVEVLVRL